MTGRSDRQVQRRRFAALAAGIAAAGVAGCFHDADPEPGAPANGDIDPDDDEPADDEDDADDEEEPPDASQWEDIDEIRLEADADGWIGVDPEPIADQENPVLILFLDQEYTITIENVDGEEHNLRIENAAGDVVEDYESDDVEEEGDEATVEFEPTEEMVLYACSYHEQSMAGEIRTEQGRSPEEPEEDAVPDEEPEEDVVDDEDDGGNATADE